MSDLIWEQSTSATDSDDPADSVAELQRDLTALSRVLLDLPLQADPQALRIAVPELPDVTPWEGAFSTSPSETMRAYDLLDPYEAEPLPIAEPFVITETHDDADRVALVESYDAFQPLTVVEPLVEVEPLVAVAPVEPAPTYPSLVPPAPAVSSWDLLGATPATPAEEPEPVAAPAPRLDGKQAATVLAELGFLDD